MGRFSGVGSVQNVMELLEEMGEGVTVSEVTGILQAMGYPKRMQAQGMENGEMHPAFWVCWRES